MSGKLTPKQGVFIAEYLVDGNGTRAAIAAGCPAASAPVTAARWLKNAKVSMAIAAAHARRVEKLDVTAARTLGELAKLSYFDPGRLFDTSGKLLPVHLLDEVTRAAVESVEIDPDTGRIKKIVMAKKGQNLERLGRYLKLFTDRIEHDGRVTLEQLVCGKRDDGAGDAANR